MGLQKLKEKLAAIAHPALCGLAVAATMALAAPAQAATITVSNKNDTGAGSLRQAITDSAAGGTINFQSGLSGTITLTSAELAVNKNLTITGPGAATLTISGNSSRRVFNVTGTTVNISGLKIINGDTSNASGSEGGGIRAASSGITLTVSNCIFDGNTATGYGGGIYNLGALTVNNSSFTNNSALNNVGGGIESEGSLIVDGSTFIGNSVANNGYGGGIANNQGSLQVSNSTFASNQAVIGGGGIYNYSNVGTATVTNCTFNSNYHTGTDSYYPLGGSGIWTRGRLVVTTSSFTSNTGYTGGGIYNIAGGVLSVTNSTFTGNTATSVAGGAIHAGNDTYYSPSLTVDSCTLTGNNGNGIYVYAGTALIKSSTITGNGDSANGGGIYNANAQTNIYNCTIAGNNATSKGGGIFRGSGTINLRDTIVAKNTVNSGGTGPDISGSVNSQDYNFIGDATGATFTGTITHNITGQDPLLGTLADNGGPTQTLALLSGSPALDNGFSGGLTSDQRGSARIYDNPSIANAAGGDGSDIGAFEAPAAAAPPTLSINDPSVTEGDSGTKDLTFTVSLSTASAQAITVNYATANGTATAGSDYTAKSGTLTIKAGQTSGTIAVPITGDTFVEANETFVVKLTTPTNATIADAQGVGTITNDDSQTGLPKVFVSDVQMFEGDVGNRTLNFTIALNSPPTADVQVNYATEAGSAKAGSDYASTTGSYTFVANTTNLSKAIAVRIIGDTTAEANETFALLLTSSTGATISKAKGIATIVNDDGAFTGPTNVSVSPNNGSGATGKSVNFTTTQTDPDGATDIVQSQFIVSTTSTGTYPVLCYYDGTTNKLYLKDDAGVFVGGFEPGSANVISNSQVSLNCSATTVIKNGKTLIVKWNLTFATTYTGTKNLYLYANDSTDQAVGFDNLGTYTITSGGTN